jgi:hypothetical protein
MSLFAMFYHIDSSQALLRYVHSKFRLFYNDAISFRASFCVKHARNGATLK